MPPRTHRHATTAATQQQQPSSSLTSSLSLPSHAKRHLRHPPSKQLQQMREDGSLYDDFPSSSSPTHSGGPGVATAVGRGSAPSRVSQRSEPGASPAAATHRNASSSSSSAQRPEREASSHHGSLTSDAATAGPPSGGISSAGAGAGVGCAVGDDGEDDGGEGKAGNTWGLTSPFPTAAAAAQPHAHHCRGISSSSFRRDSSDVRRASSSAVADRGTTAAVTVPSSVSTTHTVSPGVPGGHVVYHGVPSTTSSFSSASPRRIPVTAGVFAAAHAPPGSEQTSPAVRAVDAPGRTSSSSPSSSSISHNPNSNHRGGRCSGDRAVTANVLPPLLDHHLSAEINADTGDGDVEGHGSGADPDHHPLSVPLVASSPQQYPRSGSDIPAMAVTDADITATTTTSAAPDSTDTPADTTPLTYAAVASGTASAGSTHGKRLPQSRVCFSQWRKRTGCSSISSGGAGSVLSTAGSVVAGTGDGATATPGTQATAHAALTATNLVTGSAEASQRALSLGGFPSAPLTVMIPSAATTNASRATGRSTPASTPPAHGDDSDDSDVMNGLEDEEAADRGRRGGGGSERGRKAPPQQPHVTGHNAEDGLLLINSTAVAPAVTAAAAAAALTMPPLPPSVHRHQPTHLILQLPCTRHGQQPRIGTDSDADADEEEVKAAGNGVGGGSGGSEPPRIGHDITSAATARPTKMAAKADAPVSALHILAPPTAQSTSFSESSLSLVATPSAPMLATAATKPITPQSQSQQQRSLALISSRPPPTPQTAAGPPLASNTAFNANTPTPTRTPAQTGAVPTRGMPPRVASTASFFSAAEVLPGLFLGSYADSTDTEALAAHGISLVVNCSLECPVTPAMAHNPHHVRYVQCPLRDHSDEVIAPYFTPVTRIIHEQLHRRQINLQRLARRTKVAAAATTTGSGSCGGGYGGGSSAGPARATDVPSSVAADAGEGGEALAARLASWTWADETENVWAVPPSPASPSLSVGGQPSLKEGKRETPQTPSSAPGFGVRFGEAAMCSSTTTSCSPSPLPGRVATFPTTVAAATAVLGACASGLDGSGSTAAAAAGLPPPPPQQQVPALAPPAFSTTFTTGAPPADVAAPLSAPALAALAMAASPAPPPTPPVTVVDPRDCGGVLVHCRMGVSRSATFVMAYMILYGPTMAPLEDTASLFQHFLERERRIVEEAGGTACCTADPTTASTSITSIASPINTTRGAAHNSISGSGSGPSAFAGLLSSPPTPTPTNGPRVVAAGPAGSTFSARAHPQSPPQQQQQQPPPQLRSVSNSSLSMSPWARRRSPAIPVSASPLHLGAGNPCSSAVSAHSATPTSPIELASRVCRPCYLMRLREKRVQQHSQRQLIFSGQQPDQQQQQRRLQREEDEERDLVLAIAAANRAAATPSATPCECGPDCAHVTRPIKSACVDHDSGAIADEAAEDEYEGRRGVRLLQCRPLRTASPSSAPVLSRRSNRARGSWSSRSDLDSGAPQQQHSTTTLLEAAYADECIAQQEQQQRCDDVPCDATSAEEAPAVPPRNSADAPAPTGMTVGGAAAAIHSAARQLLPTLAPRPSDGASDNAVEGRPVLRVSPLPSPPPLPALCSSQATPLRSGAGPVRARASTGPVVTPTNTNTSITTVSGDLGVGGAGLLGVSFVSSNASGVGVGASGAVATPTSAAAAASAVAPAMTYREAFDAVKKQKSDVNPNIGFVLALRELAGGGDFSFSTSF